MHRILWCLLFLKKYFSIKELSYKTNQPVTERKYDISEDNYFLAFMVILSVESLF